MAAVTQKTVRTKIPARLDRLPWSRWHWYIVLALGTVWILDGLEVTMKGTVGPTLRDQLGMTSGQVGMAASLYVLGAITGALFWGYLTDRVGRKRLFLITLVVYASGVVLTTVSWGFYSFVVFRMITGFGIGGEYSAINSAIDELIPARARGWVDLAINGSYWLGAAIAAGLGLAYLHLLPSEYGWRAGFATGAVLAVGILLLRRSVPESPRWLMTHGREEEAERVTAQIEQMVEQDEGIDHLDEPPDSKSMELRERRSIGFVELARTLFKVYPKRSAVGFSLMASQAFTYNAIFFTYGLILTTFYGVATDNVGYYMLPFAAGNFLGPILLGRFFDTVGRRTMITLTYALAGALTVVLGYAFTQHWLGAVGMTVGWVVVFFFASAGASAGYLTVSETFPLEIRAMAIAFFYAIATGAGGIVGPWLYGWLIGDGSSRDAVFLGYVVGGGLMILGAVVEIVWGVAAEQRSLEDIALPLSAQEAGDDGAEQGPTHVGPLGVDPADADSIAAFQRQHDLEADSVVGAATRGALAAERAQQDEELELEATTVDAADVESVRAFQRVHGLVDDGVVGPQTRGAIALARLMLPLDLTDREQVRAFQREHGLADDGILGPSTQAAVRAERIALAERGGADSPPPLQLDPTDEEAARRFQRAIGLDDDGVIGPATRGALVAAQHYRWMTAGVDLCDIDQVRSFQREHGLADDGVVDGRTMDAVRRARARADHRAPGTAPLFLDPTDEDSVRYFQERHGLDATGTVDAETRQALRYEADHHLGIDPGDAATVERFQRQLGLHVDGIIGPETQGAIRAERTNREPDDEHERERRYGRFATGDGDADAGVDLAEATSIEDFQRHYGLEPDGVVGRQTQAAFRTLGAGSRRPRPAEPRRHPYRRRAMASGLWSGATFPKVDTDLDHELDAIESSLADGEVLSKHQLAERVDAAHWGPGRFGRALSVAEREHRVHRVWGRHYESTATDV